MVPPSYPCFTILLLEPSPLLFTVAHYKPHLPPSEYWQKSSKSDLEPSYSRQIRRKVSVSKEARRLGLGIFCGVWKRLNVPWSSLSLSPSISKEKTLWKTLGGGTRLLVWEIQTRSCVYWTTVRYSYGSLPPLIASPQTPSASAVQLKVDFLPPPTFKWGWENHWPDILWYFDCQ